VLVIGLDVVFSNIRVGEILDLNREGTGACRVDDVGKFYLDLRSKCK